MKGRGKGKGKWVYSVAGEETYEEPEKIIGGLWTIANVNRVDDEDAEIECATCDGTRWEECCLSKCPSTCSGSDLSVSDAESSLRKGRKREVGSPSLRKLRVGPPCGRIGDRAVVDVEKDGVPRNRMIKAKPPVDGSWTEVRAAKEKEEDKVLVEKLIMMAAKAEQSVCQMRFYVTDAQKMLASVDRISAAGNDVHFGEGKRDNWIRCKTTGRMAFMTKRNGLYLLEVDMWDGDKWVDAEIVVDSGAAGNVMPKNMMVKIQAYEDKKKARFVAADGGELGNYSIKNVSFVPKWTEKNTTFPRRV